MVINMNYGKKGVKDKQKALNSKSVKWGKKFILICLKVILVFIIAGLFSKVLSSVFDKAVTYKLENDLTI